MGIEGVVLDLFHIKYSNLILPKISKLLVYKCENHEAGVAKAVIRTDP